MAKRNDGSYRPENTRGLLKIYNPSSSGSSLPPNGVRTAVPSARSQDPLSDDGANRMDTTPPVLSMFSYLNIRGLIPQTVPSKIPFINDELSESSAIAFAITETWIDESHLDAELNIAGYTLLRQDRTRKKAKRGRSSGGVAVFIRDDYAISSEIAYTYTDGVIESLGIHITALNLILVVTYRSPDNSGQANNVKYHSTNKEFKSYLNDLNRFLSSLPTPTPDILMAGDYNLPHADWLTGECNPGACRDEQKMVKDLHELTLEHFLVQKCSFPTHIRGNMIDLLFTNNNDLIFDINTFPSPNSDHYLINFSAVYNKPFQSADDEETTLEDDIPGFNELNFFDEAIDWNNLIDNLEDYNWTTEFRGMDTNGMMERFTSVCLDVSRKWVPKCKKSSKDPSKRQKVPRHRRALMRKRARLKKKYVQTKSESSRSALLKKLIQIEKDLQKSHSDQREFEESKAIEKIMTNPKYFYSFGKKFSKVKIAIGPLINSAKKLITSPRQMAEILSEQYSSVFSTPSQESRSPSDIFPDADADNEPFINNIKFNDNELAEAMGELSANSAPGPDGFPSILLKKCRFALAPPLSAIWQQSLEDGEIPAICKSATVTPIHKGKSRAVPKNYRPVALTSHLIKVFEKVVRKHIVAYMDENNLFNQSQHGFRGGRSCLSQLLTHFDRITSELEKGHGVDIIYLDFAKAFDKVDHGITLQKLRQLGIRGRLGRWLMCFLTDRVQRVVVQGKRSAPQPVISGVPQGSVLGPLLFLVLIGDIDRDVAHSFVSSFADDTRVGKGIASADDIHHLQTDLKAIYRWSVDNNMTFNSDKFELLRYKGKSSRDLQSTSPYTSDNQSIIEEKEHVRDLGVTLSNDATFTQHIKERCIMVKSKIAWVLRTFRSRERIPMLTLWKSLIMCHLDYCSQLWSPSRTGNIQSLELLQKSFLKKISGMSEYSYWQQLEKLHMYSLERRRERYQIIYTWRIIENQIPNFESTPIKAYWNSRRGRECKVPSIISTASSAIKTIRFASLPIKGPRLFNVLPPEIRNMCQCPTERFKSELDRYLATIPDEPLLPGLTKYRRCDSNSLIDWAKSPCLHQQDRQHRRNDSPELVSAVTT